MRNQLRWLTARPIAHRGLHDLARGRPENSLAAFEAAVASHYAIECDLHLAADSVPVVFHDSALKRLTGEQGEIGDFTSKALGDLRIAGTPEWIPTLDELLRLVEGRVPLIIELKHVEGRGAGLAGEVVGRLRGYPGSAALMSFEPTLIADVRAADPSLPRGLVAKGGLRRGWAHIRTVLRLGVSFISYAIDDLPTPMPILARRLLGVPLICWTVRTPAQRRKAEELADQMTFEGFEP